MRYSYAHMSMCVEIYRQGKGTKRRRARAHRKRQKDKLKAARDKVDNEQ